MPSKPKLNLLVSYPYFKGRVREILDSHDPNSFRLIIDSGAFTVWNRGIKINLDDYCAFLKDIPSSWDYVAVQLDVFGDPKGTYNNWKRMLDLGYGHVMPVFTRGDSLDRLKEYYAQTDWIMFGGIVFGQDNSKYIKWFVQNNRGRKAHWLGYAGIPFLQRYKPFSADSSTCYGGQRFGRFDYYAGGGKLKSVGKEIFMDHPTGLLLRGLRQLGITKNEMRQLARDAAWQGTASPLEKGGIRGYAAFLSISGHLLRMCRMEKKIGTRLYQAVVNDNQVETLFESMDFLRERGAI